MYYDIFICLILVQFEFIYFILDLHNETICNKNIHFDCGGGQCIPLHKVCNKEIDCPDGEDEPAHLCHINECSVNNGGCMHQCIDQPIGYRCECESG